MTLGGGMTIENAVSLGEPALALNEPVLLQRSLIVSSTSEGL